jgi:hypothetical protein
MALSAKKIGDVYLAQIKNGGYDELLMKKPPNRSAYMRNNGATLVAAWKLLKAAEMK